MQAISVPVADAVALGLHRFNSQGLPGAVPSPLTSVGYTVDPVTAPIVATRYLIYIVSQQRHVFTYSGQPAVRQLGRPRIEMNIDEVEFLRALHLPWNKIAALLEISRHTLYRSLAEEGMLQFTEIPNYDLDDLITKGR